VCGHLGDGHSPVREILQDLSRYNLTQIGTRESRGERKLKEDKTFDTKTLIEGAKSSEHREAYKTLDRNLNFRIGIGVRLKPPDAHLFLSKYSFICAQPSARRI